MHITCTRSPYVQPLTKSRSHLVNPHPHTLPLPPTPLTTHTGVQAITFSPGSNTIIAALPGSISLYTLTDTPPTPLVTVTDVHWAPVSHMQLCDDMLVAVCSSGASVGVGVMAGMQRLMLNVRPGDHIRGSNKADPRHRALQNGVPGSPSVRTPSAAVNTVGRSPLQPEGGGARGSGSAHNGGMGSRHSHLRRSAPELVGEGGAGRSGGVRASLPASLAGVRGSRLRDAGVRVWVCAHPLHTNMHTHTLPQYPPPFISQAPVDSAMPPLNTLHIHTAAAQGPTPAQGPSATTPTAAGALNPRSPGGKGMSQWARTQRQSTGVLDAVFNGGAPMDPQGEGWGVVGGCYHAMVHWNGVLYGCIVYSICCMPSQIVCVPLHVLVEPHLPCTQVHLGPWKSCYHPRLLGEDKHVLLIMGAHGMVRDG